MNCRIVECSNKVLAPHIIYRLQFCSLQLIAIVCVVVCLAVKVLALLSSKVLAPRCQVRLVISGGLILRVAIRC